MGSQERSVFNGLHVLLLARLIARRIVTVWEGVGDRDGDPRRSLAAQPWSRHRRTRPAERSRRRSRGSRARGEARYPLAHSITLIADNATDNRAAVVRDWLAREGCRVRLVYLPPYAPNLNLIERLWWFFKKKALWNTHYRTLAGFRAAIRGFFDNLGQWKAELASLLTKRFHLIGHQTPQIPSA
jgi:transposase